MNKPSADNDHQRPIWIIIFAILLASFALRAKAVEPDPVRINQVQMAGKRMVIPQTKAVKVVQGSDSNLLRPAYVSLRANLAQWDRDADPDGWIATVQIWTAEGKRLLASDFRSTPLASFSLMPRRPLHERVGYRTPVVSPETWTAKIKLDENGIATVRLPLRHRLTWNAAWGELHVRVGVAGESTFHAVSPVALRTTVLVDTRWPDH